jgi:hypothetical protein
MEHLSINKCQAPTLVAPLTPAHGGVFCQKLSNPVILSLRGSHDENQVVARGIVGMKEVGNDTYQAKASCDDE